MFAIYWTSPCSLQTTCGLYWAWATSTKNGGWAAVECHHSHTTMGFQPLVPLNAQATYTKETQATEVI